MAFPIVVAPIFALYTTNKNAVFDYSAVNTESVDINAFQFIENGFPSDKVDTLNTWSIDDGSVSLSDNKLSFDDYGVVYSTYDVSINNSDKFYFSFDYVADGIFDGDLFFEFNDTYTFNFVGASSSGNDSNIFVASDDFNGVIGLCFDGGAYFQIYNLQLFNLTDIFGSGNEPSLSVFESYLIKDYYVYGENTISIGTQNVTYSDSDIGSQFIYSMYNCVDKYFNYDRVFNFGDLYTWLNTTFFSGSAPLGFFIFWHLLIYWLLTSILWLVFDVLMYVPQLVHRWLDKASIS